MAFIERMSFSTVHVFVLVFFLGKGTCDSVCPNGIKNITGETSGTIVYPSSGTYGVNETKCWRIEVPKPYEGLGIYLNSYDIEECRNCECDRLTFGNTYNAILYSNLKCGRKVNILQSSDPESENGENIWIRFVSDDTVHYKGFNLSYIVKSDTPSDSYRSFLNASGDEPISFGTPKVGLKNYPASFEWLWYLIVPEGRQVQITFESFELEQSKDCENDYLEVREADKSFNGEYGPILSKPVCGTNMPSTIQSAGNKVWVIFKSDSNTTTTYKGFKASFTASGQGRLAINHLMTLLFTSALLVFTSKDSVF